MGAGEPVILIHGFFFDSLLWCGNITALAKSYRVYAIDLWGFGYSARATPQLSYDLYSQQIHAFMKEMGIEKATLVGQSLGGGVAIQFSVKFPEMVKKLVLVDSAGLENPEPFAARLFRMPGVGELLMNFPVNAVRKKMLKDFFLHKPGTIPADLFERLTWFQKIEGTTFNALALMRLGFADKLKGSLQRLAEFNLPIMVVWGAQDNAIHVALGRQIHHELPGSLFFIIQNAGHVPNLEQPEMFNSIVETFLREGLDAAPIMPSLINGPVNG